MLMVRWFFLAGEVRESKISKRADAPGCRMSKQSERLFVCECGADMRVRRLIKAHVSIADLDEMEVALGICHQLANDDKVTWVHSHNLAAVDPEDPGRGGAGDIVYGGEPVIGGELVPDHHKDMADIVGECVRS